MFTISGLSGRSLLAAVLSAVLVFATVMAVVPTLASAQERNERRTLLQMLFGKQNRSVTSFEERPAQQRRVKRNKSSKAQPAANAVAAVEKLPTAKKVLVIGDFIAAGLGEGLATGFAGSASVVVETRSNGSSGIVRDDYYNWPVELPKLIAEIQPSILVISIGSNDRQQFRSTLVDEKFASEAWRTEYARRVDALAEIGRTSRLPVLWVGMPAFQSSAMTADMVTLNGIFRTQSEKVGGQFVDIWDGFVDEAGKFIVTGSDINGQQVRLRGSDGINLTKAGKRKMAFYVEKEIIRLLGGDAATGTGTESILSSLRLNDAVVVPAVSQEILETQPIGLADPELDGGATLLGASMPKTLNLRTPRDNLVERGEVAEAPAGRVDDFRLAKPDTALTAPVIRK